MATPRPKSDGITGVRARAATPRVRNTAARVASPVPIADHDIPPRAISTGVRRASAPVMTINAAAPGRAASIGTIAAAIMTSAPARTTRPLPISSQDIPPMAWRAFWRITRAPATRTRPAAEMIIVGGSSAIAPATSARAAAIPAIPLPSSPQLMSEKSPTTVARILRAPARSTRPADCASPTLLAEASLLNIPRARRVALTPARPLPIEAQSMLEKSRTALARILIAAATAIIPTPADTSFP